MRHTQILISTTPSFEGLTIQEYLGVVSAHVVAGTGLFSDIFASFSDIFGGRSESYQRQLDAIKNEALDLLQKKASEKKANAIVGVRIDHDEVSGGNKSMFMVTVSGTAVIVDRCKIDQAITHERPLSVEPEEVNRHIRRSKLINQINKKKVLPQDNNTWQFIFSNEICEIASTVIDTIEKAQNPNIHFVFDKNIARNYFASIPVSISKQILYKIYLGDRDSLHKFALNTIRFLNLFDYGEIRPLLFSKQFSKRKRALLVMFAEKATYIPEDIGILKTAVTEIKKLFPKRSKDILVEKTFSTDTKQVWECECGKNNSKHSTHCSKCMRDQYGFKNNEKTSRDVINHLNNKINALEQIFQQSNP